MTYDELIDQIKRTGEPMDPSRFRRLAQKAARDRIIQRTRQTGQEREGRA